ncbi:MAG: tyrosine-type recombinase/integrase [Aestuariivirga sp.]
MARKISEIPWLDLRDGVYYAFWYDKDTRRTHRFSLRTGNASEAQSAFAVFLTEGRAIHQRIATQPTVAEVLDYYLKEHGPKLASRSRQEIAGENLKRHIGSYRIGAVDGPVCRGYASDRRKEGSHQAAEIRNATINREIGVLRAAANFGAKNRFMAKGDLPLIHREEDDTRKRRALTKAELHAALETDDQDLFDYIMVLFYTGGRRRAIERLSKAQVDFEQGVIHQAMPGERQTKKRRPTIPLIEEIRPILLRRFEANPDRLFPTDSMAKKLKKHLQGLGIEDAAMAHTLRHTRATLLLLDDVPIYKVAQLLGDTVSTIESTYAHVLAKDLRDVGGKI